MKIETKLGLFDTAYFMDNNVIKSAEVKEISIRVFPQQFRASETNITYVVGDHGSYNYTKVFTSKEELLESL